MNWSGKMWALQYKSGQFESVGKSPETFSSREYARQLQRRYYQTAKVVRVQVDVKVSE